MFKYKIINKPPLLKIDKKIVDFIFNEINSNINIAQKWLINLIFENDDVIKSLNNQYRSINNSTDVLSFHYFDNFENLKLREIAWEILFSREKIKKQSIDYQNSINAEFYKLLIHSILHIIGFDHEEDNDFEVMKKEEEKIILNIKNIFWIKIL